MQGNDHAYHDESVACQTLSWSVRLTPQPWRKVEEDVLCQEKFRLEVANKAPHASAGGFNFVPILQDFENSDFVLLIVYTHAARSASSNWIIPCASI